MHSRWLWRTLAFPGVAWLSVFFLVALYAVLSVALGNQNTLSEPVPFWNPLDWNTGYLIETLRNFWEGEQFLTVFLRTFAYVAIALGYSAIYQATVKLGLWRCVVESLDISNPAVLEQVTAAGQPASPVGEGLADALSVGGI